MTDNPMSIKFNDVVKNPYIYLLITVVSLLWYFVYSYTGLNEKNDVDCKQVNTELRQENKKLREDKDNLVNSILVKNGVIDNLNNITDSLNKKTKNEH